MSTHLEEEAMSELKGLLETWGQKYSAQETLSGTLAIRVGNILQVLSIGPTPRSEDTPAVLRAFDIIAGASAPLMKLREVLPAPMQAAVDMVAMKSFAEALRMEAPVGQGVTVPGALEELKKIRKKMEKLLEKFRQEPLPRMRVILTDLKSDISFCGDPECKACTQKKALLKQMEEIEREAAKTSGEQVEEPLTPDAIDAMYERFMKEVTDETQ
mgnify:CR=1 FL=1